MRATIIILFLFTINQCFYGQSKDYFSNGFNDGYKETCNQAGYGGYANRGDSRDCSSTQVYNSSIESNVNDKLYADGYRCGTIQATKMIEKLKIQLNSGNGVQKDGMDSGLGSNLPTRSLDYPDVNIDKNIVNYNYNQVPVQKKVTPYVNINTSEVVAYTMMAMERNYSSRPKESDYSRKCRYVNEMLYKYDEKLYKKSQQTKKKSLSKSESLKKEIDNKIQRKELFRIDDLSDGWYQVVSVIDETFAYKTVQVSNHNVINWINSLEVIFPIVKFSRYYDSQFSYSATVSMPDGFTQKGDMYFVNNKPLNTPTFYEPSIVLFYTKNFIDGDMIYVRVYNDLVNQMNGVGTSWISPTAPECNENTRVIKFYLPKGKSYNFHANTKTCFWTGEIVTLSECKAYNLN